MTREERKRPPPRESSSPNSGTGILIRSILLQTPEQRLRWPSTSAPSPVSDPSPGPTLACQNLVPGLLSFGSHLYAAPTQGPGLRWSYLHEQRKSKSQFSTFMEMFSGRQSSSLPATFCKYCHQASLIINLLYHDV